MTFSNRLVRTLTIAASMLMFAAPAFGAPSAPTVTEGVHALVTTVAVPTLSEWAMIGCGVLIVATGLFMQRRRQLDA